MIRFSIQIALLLLVVFFAWKKGGRPERHVAVALLGMQVASIAHALLSGQWTQYDEIPLFRVAVDLLGLGIFLLVALRADRWWPMWLSAFQLQAVLAHALRAIHADLPPLVYAIMERWPFWIAILLTALGTFNHARKTRLDHTS